MRAKEHYDTHLADIYSWMVGDIDSKSTAFKTLLISNGIEPNNTKTAIDLGAGNGIQSFAMKDLGFHVTAVDFNQKLLDELRANPKGAGVNIALKDITQVAEFENLKPELIVCCGDTITHLESKNQVERLIGDACRVLEPDGYLIFTFRDYSRALEDEQRFIPVKATVNRILTCILEYQDEKIKVTDLLYENFDGEWVQRVSSYEKLRINPKKLVRLLKENAMEIKLNEPINRMQTIIAKKTC